MPPLRRTRRDQRHHRTISIASSDDIGIKNLEAYLIYKIGISELIALSMLKTLAGKHKSTVTKMAHRYKTVIDTPDGKRTCFQVTVSREGKKPLISRFGGIALKRQRATVLTDLSPIMASTKRNELIHRLLADCCEICGSRTQIEVHHVRKLADLNRPDRPDKPTWVHLMAQRRRRPSSSAANATRTSTPDAGPPHPPGTDYWRAV
jgi:hypothetical protein